MSRHSGEQSPLARSESRGATRKPFAHHQEQRSPSGDPLISTVAPRSARHLGAYIEPVVEHVFDVDFRQPPNSANVG